MGRVMNLGLTLRQAARHFPERVGLVHGQQRWSFAELEANAASLARALVVGDLLNELGHALRPYEREPGSVDAVLEHRQK